MESARERERAAKLEERLLSRAVDACLLATPTIEKLARRLTMTGREKFLPE